MSAKISIITITFQAEKYVERTLQSVGMQDHRSQFEYIIIDGGSTDQTLDLLNKYAHLTDFVQSESDQGIYDAMNKGLQNANGEYVLFLNAGDTFANEHSLKEILAQLKSNPDILYGDANFVDTNGQLVGLRSEITPHQLPENLRWTDFKYGMLVCHQSFIPKKSIAPLFSLEYQLSSDIDWEINCLKVASFTKKMETPICNYLTGGASVQNLKKSWQERFAIIRKHFGLVPSLWFHLIIVLRGLKLVIKKGGKYW